MATGRRSYIPSCPACSAKSVGANFFWPLRPLLMILIMPMMMMIMMFLQRQRLRLRCWRSCFSTETFAIFAALNSILSKSPASLLVSLPASLSALRRRRRINCKRASASKGVFSRRLRRCRGLSLRIAFASFAQAALSLRFWFLPTSCLAKSGQKVLLVGQQRCLFLALSLRFMIGQPAAAAATPLDCDWDCPQLYLFCLTLPQFAVTHFGLAFVLLSAGVIYGGKLLFLLLSA